MKECLDEEEVTEGKILLSRWYVGHRVLCLDLSSDYGMNEKCKLMAQNTYAKGF